jgi:hypothetical protein
MNDIVERLRSAAQAGPVPCPVCNEGADEIEFHREWHENWKRLAKEKEDEIERLHRLLAQSEQYAALYRFIRNKVAIGPLSISMQYPKGYLGWFGCFARSPEDLDQLLVEDGATSEPQEVLNHGDLLAQLAEAKRLAAMAINSLPCPAAEDLAKDLDRRFTKLFGHTTTGRSAETKLEE